MKAFLPIAVVVITGCGAPLPDWIASEQFSADLPVDVNALKPVPPATDVVYFEDVVAGGDEVVEAGDVIQVHYTGWLPNGNKFDSSRDRGEPATFQIGVGRLIPGWDQAIPGMRVGGRRTLVIPPSLGYGERGAGENIPPGATLVFDVEVMGIENPAPPGS